MGGVMSKRYDVSPGPARWDRAKANAEKKPDSHGAKLYRTRVETATRLESQYGNVPYQIMRNEAGFYADTPKWKRKHAVCSAYCALLNVQLSLQNQSSDEAIHQAMLAYPIHGNRELMLPLVEGDLKRSTMCFVCGCRIEPDLSVSGTSFISTQPAAKADHTPSSAPKITVRADTMRSIIEGLEAIESEVNGYGALKECVIDVSENDVRITATFDKHEWTLELESVG